MTKYNQYVENVLTGKIVTCEYVKLACKRYQSFLQRKDMYFDAAKVQHVISFISNIKHFKDDDAGKNFILTDWQEFCIASIFGFKWIDSDKRVTKNAFLLMAKKNGKTAFIIAILIYLFVAEGVAAPEIILACTSRDSAKGNLLDTAVAFIESIDPKGKYLKAFRNEIKYSKAKGYMKIISADAKKFDGKNISAYAYDEYHEAMNDKLYGGLRSSTIARKTSIGLVISTAGFNLTSPCYEMYTTATEILRGTKTDDSFFCMLFQLDEDDDWTNENIWIKANPNLGVTVSLDELKIEVINAINNPSQEVNVKTKNLNMWCSSSETWLTRELIVKNLKKLDINDFEGCSCTLGVDLAKNRDLTALSVMIKKDGIYYFITHYFLPFSALTEHKQKELYKKWHNQKQINITPGNVTDYDYVTNEILKINEVLPIDMIYYDAYNASQWVIDATNKGLSLTPFSQLQASYNRPTKEFERLIYSDKVVIDANDITVFCFENVVLKPDNHENVKPLKVSEGNKIDGVISMLTAMGGYLQNPVEEYDTEIYSF